MTIWQSRILALAISISYIPSYMFGFVTLWTICLILAITHLFGHQIKAFNSTHAHNISWRRPSQPLLRRLYTSLFFIALTPNVGVAIAATLQGRLDGALTARAESSTLDTSAFDVISRFLGAPDAYSSLPTYEQMALHVFVLSIALAIVLTITKHQALWPLIRDIYSKKVDAHASLDERFGIYLHYKSKLATEFPVLALIHIIYVISLNYFLQPHIAYSATSAALSILLPPFLFLETFVFIVRSAVYFKHF